MRFFIIGFVATYNQCLILVRLFLMLRELVREIL
jgi:hypothetical protein